MEHLDERDLNIYTDGSSYSKPRRAGIGIRFVTVDEDGEERVDDFPLPGFEGASNQQAEIAACLEALKAIVTHRAPVDATRFRWIVIWTDSLYLAEGFDSARFHWPLNDWHTRDKNPVANVKQWQELVKMASRTGKRVEFRWVKGHGTSVHNKAVDKLAKQSAATRTSRRLSVTKVRRKKTSASVQRGSVRMEGQRLTIRIITDGYQRAPHMNTYKYEVMSRASMYHGCVDIIHSAGDLHLSAGHTYYVLLNKDSKQPRIAKLYREIVSRSSAKGA